jgi:phospholipid/cholesterol/gamma-HCH transport system permease protein
MPLPLLTAVKEVQDISLLTARAFSGTLRRPYYVRDVIFQMDSIGVGSIVVVILTGFFTGAELTLQTADSLSRFGAKTLTGTAVSLTLVRELGPVLASLMVAGRSGSGIASELGSMIVTEQVNAMRALGTDPVKKLVAPRLIAAATMMPLLTILADALGILGGLVIATVLLQLSAQQYLSSAWNGLEYMDIIGGLIKPVVFGAIIALVSCHCGLRTHGGTQGVGRSTTQAVVVSSVLILVFNFLMTKVLLEFGY